MNATAYVQETFPLPNWGRAIVVSGYGMGAVYGGVMLSDYMWLGLGLIFCGMAMVFLGCGWPSVYRATSRRKMALWIAAGAGLCFVFAAQIAMRTLI
jgi:hypothetical protein